jgi:hypothetical protein
MVSPTALQSYSSNGTQLTPMAVDGQNFAKCSASASAFLFSGGVKNEKGALSKTTENDVIKWSIGEKISVSVSVSVSVSLLTPPIKLVS